MDPLRPTLKATSLVVFVDETGEESLSDPDFPVFGMAGCAMRADTYFGSVAESWRALKESHFGGRNVPMHAAAIDRDNKAGIAAIGEFFLREHFSRFGVVLSSKTALVGIESFEATALALLQRMKEVARWWNFEELRFIYELSGRLRPLVEDHFSRWNYRRKVNGEDTIIPVVRHFMPKTTNEPGLQIADFIAHTLGASERSRLSGATEMRKDFRVIFADVDQKLVSRQSIQAVEKKYQLKE
jgi:hypothetical protein